MGASAGAALAALTVTLTDWHPRVRQTAARSLARVGGVAGQAVPALIQLLADRDEGVREAAVESLARIGPDAVLGLVETVEARQVSRADELLRQRLRVTEWYDHPPRDDFEAEQLHTLRKADWCWRYAVDDDLRLEMLHEAVLRVLGKIGPAAGAAVPAVAGALAYPSGRVRREAAAALGQIGVQARPVLPTLALALLDDAEPVRKSTAEALGQIHPDWAALVEMHEVVARLAADLKQNGPRGVAAVDALVAAGNAGVPLLVQALASDDRIEREAAATALGRLGPRAEAALPALRLALQDSHGWVRDAAAKALRQIVPGTVH
jgi:HEAT repeat protein